MTAALLAVPTIAEDKKDEAPVVEPRKGKSETIKLFNGKDLDGWEGFEEYWSVKDGVIVATRRNHFRLAAPELQACWSSGVDGNLERVDPLPAN
jgi:hypothetical protein